MAKDPAFLFYPGDWLGGTMGMTIEQKGAYMELLIFQFNNGKFSKAQAEQVLSICFARVWDMVHKKFMHEAGMYWNERLDFEIEKRKKFSDSRRINALTKKTTVKNSKAYAEHMENENENENRSKKEIKEGGTGETIAKQKTRIQLAGDIWSQFMLEAIQEPFAWEAKEMPGLKKIMQHIERKLQTGGKEVTDETVCKGWTMILEKRNEWPEWLKDKWELSMISSKFNEIYAKLKNGNTGKSKHQPNLDPEVLRRGAERIAKIRAGINPDEPYAP